MNIETTNIPGLLVIRGDILQDDRGYFLEQYQQEKLMALGFPKDFTPVQINFVKNDKKGTLRGLHMEPWNKYVSIIKGKGFGAWVDLRDKSQKNVFSTELLPGTAVFVPNGVANSYQTLEDETYYVYAVSDHWKPGIPYVGIHPFDPELAIPWPLNEEESVLSEKDMKLPLWKEIAHE